MSTPTEPTRRTRMIAIVVVFALLAVGLFFGIRAVVEAAGSHSATKPTPSPSSTEVGFAYTSEQYGYTVKFPSEPAEQSKTVPVGDDDVQLTSAVWTDGTRTLVSNGATYPAGSLKDVDASLKSSLTNAVANVTGARLTSSDPTKLDGLEAVRANILVPSGTLRIIIAIDGDTQYQLVAENTDQTTSDGFFNSFSLG